jgi:predicted nucleic acid-binding protein
MKVALDTNILAYAEGVNGVSMQEQALALLENLPSSAVVIPAQSLGELFNVLVRKAKRRAPRARAAVLSWHDTYAIAETSSATVINATDLAATHGLSIWDSVILAVAAQAECRLLISEDLQDGFTWHGVTVANPFSSSLNPLLKNLLSSAS